MIVVNTIGYDFSFKYDGKDGTGNIIIPFNQIPYNVPDDIPKFKELKEVVIVDVPSKIKQEPIKEDVIVSLSDDNQKDQSIKLQGKKIKKKKKKQILSKKV